MNKLLRLVSSLLVTLVAPALLLTGCAIGNKISYTGDPADLSLRGDGKVAVATQDARPYVVTGKKSPTFVGLQRGGYGNPFDVTTASGRALSEDFTDTLVTTLRSAGFAARAVAVTPAEAKDGMLSKAGVMEGSERLVLLRLVEWKSDTYNRTRLLYDVVLEVRDPAGQLLGEASFAGSEDLGGSVWNPASHAKEAVPQAYRRLVGSWLSDPRIAAALS